EADLARTTTAARGQCGQPVEITRGANGGGVVDVADRAQLQGMKIKGLGNAKKYNGRRGKAGGPARLEVWWMRGATAGRRREGMRSDGRTMVLRGMDPEVAGRYGTGVYVRCAPEGVARAGAKPKPAAQ